MSAPIIGITTRKEAGKTFFPALSVPIRYVRAVARAGGIPVLIPIGIQVEELPVLCERLDGILFAGGGDVDPSLYGGELMDNFYEVDLERDELEIELTRIAVKEGIPFLGICRGIQVVNVALGGNLIPDIASYNPKALQHPYVEGDAFNKIMHTVSIHPGTILSGILGQDELNVNSLHHQAALEPGEGLVVSAIAPDGVIEGLELPDHPFGINVQWHPEWIYDDQEHARKLFTSFIEKARKDQ